MSQEFSYADVSEHASKKDIYMIIHDKVYNTTSFVDEHPGGEEVMLDVGGQDATEAFEDVGHSDEAREILEGMLIGTLKRQPGDPAPASSAKPTSSTSGSSGSGLGTSVYALLAVGGVLAYLAYNYLQSQSETK